MHNHVRQPPVDEIELSNFELAAARRETNPVASLGCRLGRQQIRGGAWLTKDGNRSDSHKIRFG